MTELNAQDLQQYLHKSIPLTVAMGLEVIAADRHRVSLAAPLAPNINHQLTGFGGSVAAIATLAAWSLLHLRCQTLSRRPDLVIQRSETEYLRPVTDTLCAVCEYRDEAAWGRAVRQLESRGQARIEMASRLELDGEAAARFRGRFALRWPESGAADGPDPGRATGAYGRPSAR